VLSSRLRLPAVLSLAFAVTAAIACAVTAFNPGILREPDPATTGSMRGTAVVLLVVGVPVLVGAVLGAVEHAPRAGMVWLGTLVYALYNAAIFAIGTSFTRLFPVYLLMFALALWAVVTLAMRIDHASLPEHVTPGLRLRFYAVYLLLMVAGTAALWLGQLVPGLVDNTVPTGLDKTSMPTSLFHVMDFSIVLPLMTLAAVWLSRGQGRGYLLTGAFLIYGILEAIGVAVDQWFAHIEDPSSPLGGIAVFGALAVVSAIVAVAYFRHITVERRREDDSPPAAA
jgi:hypothetical protein